MVHKFPDIVSESDNSRHRLAVVHKKCFFQESSSGQCLQHKTTKNA